MTPCAVRHARCSGLVSGRLGAMASRSAPHAASSCQSRCSAPWTAASRTKCRAGYVSRRHTLDRRRLVRCCASLELTEENVEHVLEVRYGSWLLSSSSDVIRQTPALSIAGSAHRAAAALRRECRHHRCAQPPPAVAHSLTTLLQRSQTCPPALRQAVSTPVQGGCSWWRWTGQQSSCAWPAASGTSATWCSRGWART